MCCDTIRDQCFRKKIGFNTLNSFDDKCNNKTVIWYMNSQNCMRILAARMNYMNLSNTFVCISIDGISLDVQRIP